MVEQLYHTVFGLVRRFRNTDLNGRVRFTINAADIIGPESWACPFQLASGRRHFQCDGESARGRPSNKAAKAISMYEYSLFISQLPLLNREEIDPCKSDYWQLLCLPPPSFLTHKSSAESLTIQHSLLSKQLRVYDACLQAS